MLLAFVEEIQNFKYNKVIKIMLNIAICDDIAILRETINNHIKSYEIEKGCSFNIIHFDSGEELVGKIGEGNIKFNLYFLDFYMRELTGYETAKHIRQFDTDSHIVLLCEYSNYTYKFRDVKPLEMISKPVLKDDIYNILNKILQR